MGSTVFVVKTVFSWVASRANMYLAVRTHNCVVVCHHGLPPRRLQQLPRHGWAYDVHQDDVLRAADPVLQEVLQRKDLHRCDPRPTLTREFSVAEILVLVGGAMDGRRSRRRRY